MYIDTNAAIPIDRISSRSKHVAVLGMTGAGKTNTIYVWIEEELNAGGLVMIIDPEGDYYPLKSRYDLLIAGKGRKGNPVDVAISPDNAGRAAEFLSTCGVSVIVDLSGYTLPERNTFLLGWLGTLWMQYQDEDLLPIRIVIDEIQLFAPQGKQTASKELIQDIAARGRKRNFALLVATQRPQSVDKSVLDACAIRILHRVELGKTLDAIRDLLPGHLQKKADDILPAFQAGEAILKLDADSHTIRVRQSDVFEHKDTPIVDRTSTGINPQMIEQLKALLSAPPEVATDDVKSLKEQIVALKAEVNRLNEQLAVKSAPPVANPSPVVLPSRDTATETLPPVLSDLAKQRRINADNRQFEVLVNSVKKLRPSSIKALKELVIQDKPLSAGKLALLAGLSEVTIDRSACLPLQKLGLVRRLKNNVFEPTVAQYLRTNCENLDTNALVVKLIESI